jgi:hypothetical protein
MGLRMTIPRTFVVKAGKAIALGEPVLETVPMPPPPGAPPSFEVAAFATGLPASLLGFQFHHDPGVVGEYAIDISMNGGNMERLFVDSCRSMLHAPAP